MVVFIFLDVCSCAQRLSSYTMGGMTRSDSTPSLAAAIARARAEAGLSLRELSRRSGVPTATIHAIESGRIPRPGLGSAAALAAALGLPLEDLAALVVPPSTPERVAG